MESRRQEHGSVGPLRAHWRAWGGHAAFMFAFGFGLSAVPFARAFGYEGIVLSTLLIALVLPLTWLHAGRDERSSATSLPAFLGLAATAYAGLVTVSMATTSGCEVPQGMRALVLVGLPGLVLAYGICELIRRHTRRFRRSIFAVIWLAMLARSLHWFLSEPVYRAAHPLAGLMLGPPTETQDVMQMRVAWFALERLALGACLAWSAAVAQRGWRAIQPVDAAAIAALGGMSLGLWSQSAELGYRIDRSHLDERLRDRVSGQGLEHVFAPLIPTDLRPWIVLEAEYQRHRQAVLLDLDELPPARMYWFADKDHKQDLTGARSTMFAKVHLGEVYLSAETFPPIAVGHELAHVTSGHFSDGLLRVPGRLGGIWYNPALVEGFAMAVDWSDHPLNTHEQARVALEKGRLPPLQDLFTPLGFVTINKSVAYTASGSFLRFCIEEYGADALGRWYRDEDFEAAMGEALPSVEAKWHQMLGGLAVRETDGGATERRQARPAMGAESCDRAESRERLGRAMRARADDEVERMYQLLASEGGLTTEVWLEREAYLAARDGYRTPRSPEPPRELGTGGATRYQTLAALSLWANGDRAAAEQVFAELPPSQRAARDVIVARALIRDGFALEDLVAPPGREVLVHLTRRFEETRHPVIGFLLARRLWKKQDWWTLRSTLRHVSFEAFAFPDDVPGDVPLVLAQMNGLAAFGLRDWSAAHDHFQDLIELAPGPGRAELGREWQGRIAYFRAHEQRLSSDLPRARSSR